MCSVWYCYSFPMTLTSLFALLLTFSLFNVQDYSVVLLQHFGETSLAQEFTLLYMRVLSGTSPSKILRARLSVNCRHSSLVEWQVWLCGLSCSPLTLLRVVCKSILLEKYVFYCRKAKNSNFFSNSIIRFLWSTLTTSCGDYAASTPYTRDKRRHKVVKCKEKKNNNH